jgi:hypothetical protein
LRVLIFVAHVFRASRLFIFLFVVVLAASLLAGCTSLFFVHDPQSGLISAGQVPGFLKSVRCELITFYDLEARRKSAYAKLAKVSIAEAFERYAYFEVEPTMYGTFTTELKVTDASAALAGATAFDYKQVRPSWTATSQIAPSVSTQATDDLIWSFILQQNARLTSTDAKTDPLHRGCYIGPPLELLDLETFADGRSEYPATFTRILVNGQKPFAAWLRDNGITLSANYLGTSLQADGAEPAQMTYTFTIQVVAGLEGKYSLVATSFSPTLEASGSLQQNSTLTIYINGPAAPTANTAKAGGAFLPKPPAPVLGSKDNPMYVYPETGLPEKGKEKGRILNPGGRPPATPAAPGGAHYRGYLLFPPTVVPPAATPNP